MYGREYVPDNYDQYRKHEAELENAKERLPICCMCNREIEDYECWQFGDEPICDECAEKNFRVKTADLME